MRFDLLAYLPSRISCQIVALVIVSLLASHIVLTILFFLHLHEKPPDRFESQLATVIELIATTPSKRRDLLLAASNRAFPNFDLELVPGPPLTVAPHAAFNPELDYLARRLGPNHPVQPDGNDPQRTPHNAQRIVIGLGDGQFVAAQLAAMSPPTLLGPVALTWIVIAFSVPLLSLWAALGLTGPLRRFALAAENFNPNDEILPVPERGPQEIRVAARALNQMRKRIKTLIDDRTHMLAAVSHDLRTPITRLRLHCEFIGDTVTCDKIRSELHHMEAMVDGVLHFLQHGNVPRTMITLDLATSLQSICDQFTDAHFNVAYYGPDHAAIRANPEELHRALTNLIDNAARHGSKVDLTLTLSAPSVTVRIEDDGPGIPESSKEAMFEPFVRGDFARSMNGKIGFGLGLSISRAVVEAHGGTLALLDRKPHGLVAEVILPRA